MESKHRQEVSVLKVHLALYVTDVETSVDFYRKLFGIDPCKVRSGYAKFDVQNPPLNLTLNQATLSGSGTLSHLGLQVATSAAVLAMRKQWSAAGLLTRDEMQTDCCYALQDKTWVRDPDGNEWEVFVVLEDNLAETAPRAGEDKDAAPVLPIAQCCPNSSVALIDEQHSEEARCR